MSHEHSLGSRPVPAHANGRTVPLWTILTAILALESVICWAGFRLLLPT